MTEPNSNQPANTSIASNKDQDENKENAENEVYSLQDLIESEKEQNEIASAVLGASDAQNCSYNQGYVYRQALYCCITCLKANQTNKDDLTKLHGICLACSYECHQNHELCELYTKRYFRCDCGNSKFSNNKCKLETSKDETNNQNKYNHNFNNGLYCVCNRPYPDTESNPDDTINNDEMIQCTICEDWYHLKHLLGNQMYNVTDENDYEEMICHLCMSKNEFLWYYQDKMAFKTGNDEKVDIETVNQEPPKDTCKLDYFKDKNQIQIKEKFLGKELCCFLLDGWRDQLCQCEKCLNTYKSMGLEFLLKSNDTIKYYEECGKQKDKTCKIDETKLLNDELSKMNHVSQLEFLHNVNDFKQDLKEFLANFARNGQVVKRENIVEFFDELNEKTKKRRLNSFNSNGYFCK